MKTLILLLISFSCFAQYPTVTSSLSYSRDQTAHGLTVGQWITIEGGIYVAGSDPSAQPLFGIVSKVVNTNRFEFAPTGGPITLSGLTPDGIYYAQSDGSISLTNSGRAIGKALSTTVLVLYSGSFTTTIPPPNTQATVSITGVTSTTMTASGQAGSGDGRILLASASPITVTPANNIVYNANLNFSSGDEIGTGVYVVGFGDITSVVITGLSANTPYYVVVYEYVQQNTLITYNLVSGLNSDDGITLADATTPTVQFETTSVKSKETGIQVTGIRGPGDNIIALSSNLGQPDTDPVDGVSYSLGQTLGNSTVAYIGTASTFFIDGYTQDRKVWWKIMEFENTGLLYNIQAPIDSAYTALFYEGGTGAFVESTDPPGVTYLENNAFAWYIFNFAGADESSPSNGDPAFTDLSGNANTATIVGAPQVNEITLNGTQKAIRSASGTGLSTGNVGTNWFNLASGNEVHFSGEILDGIVASGVTTVYGTQGATWRMDFRFVADGRGQIQFTGPAGASNWVTTAPVLVNGSNIISHGKVKLDFVNDVFSLVINGTNHPGATSGGVAISAHDPTAFSSSQPVYIGNTNNAGSPTGMTSGTNISISGIAFTGITTTQQSLDIGEVMAFTASAGNSFVKLDKEGSVGAENVADSLHLDGTEDGAFTNRLIYVGILSDTIEEYEVGISFKISGALTTAASGLGVGTLNDLATENNYAVMGQMNLDTDAASFGKVQIFSGNGTIDNDDFSHRGTSSGGFIPALDSTYRMTITRVLQGNDAAYTLEVFDYYDSAVHTIAWVETGRPSSAFYGTTNRPFIWYQGPDFMIGEFWVVRVGEDVSPPSIITANVYVTLGGVDTATGTITTPRRSLNGGIQRCVELGAPCVISMGPGRFEEGTRAAIPVGVSVFGQGKDVTVISGVAGLENGFSTNNTLSLIQYTSINVTSGGDQYLRNLTIEGRERRMPTGISITNRDDIVFEDIAIRNFSTFAVHLRTTDNVTLTRVTMQYTGGDNGSPPVNNMAPAAGTSQGTFATGAVTFGFASNITFTDCTVDNSPYRMGYGTNASTNQPGLAGLMTNVTWTGGSIATNTLANLSTTVNIAIELFPCTFNNVLFENVILNGGASNIGGGYISVVNPTTATHAGSGYITFDNIDYTVNTGALEFAAHKMVVKNSYIHGLVRRLFWQTSISAPADIQEWDFLNNVVELSNVTSHMSVWNKRMIDCEIRGNTFRAMPGTKPSSAPFIVQSFVGGTSSFTVENNIFQDNFGTGSTNFFNVTGTGLASSFVRGNRSNWSNIQQTIAGVTGGSGNNNTITTTANPWGLTLSGLLPWPYYTPNVSLDGAGQGAGNIGAREADVP